MDSFIQKLLNVILYPEKLYGKLTNKRSTLYIGIIIVGMIDLFLPDILKRYNGFFTDKTASVLQYNIIIAAALVILLGLLDVVFFSFPVFDIFKYIKKKEESQFNVSSIQVMKVYIMSYFIIIPVNVLLYYLLFRYVNGNSSLLLININVLWIFISMIWSSAIVTRGINTLFNFNQLFRRLTFIVVFIWNFLLSWVFEMVIMDWFLKLFK